MRSQASKTLKKGVVSKTAFKARSNTKQVKKKLVISKKGKNLANKTISRNAKKTLEESIHQKDEDESSNSEKSDSPDSSKAGTSKTGSSRSESPTKKTRKDPKEKKDSPKGAANIKKILAKKCPKKPKGPKAKSAKATEGDDNDNIKYKINSSLPKKLTSKVSKAKVLLRKSSAIQKKKTSPATKLEGSDKNDKKDEIPTQDNNTKECGDNNQETIPDSKNESEKLNEKPDEKEYSNNSGLTVTSPNSSVLNSTETSPKVEIERPPKFFTSSRPPRTVDIDVKYCKNSKGNLSVSERFLSMKCETKTDENTKEKSVLNTLVSPGPEIDVYTFTEKVDSPKSILSGFRTPVNKNVGRVRPIARVKGTIIDKKEVEKKKYSPHRPIEEVVKQLKAKKGNEELNSVQNDATSSLSVTVVESTDKEIEEKPIISKSYKMVARKSSITGKPFSPIKFLDHEPVINKGDKEKPPKISPPTKKATSKLKKSNKKSSLSDEDIDTSKFSLNTKSFHYTSSDESNSESNDDHDSKESSGSDSPKNKKNKAKKYKRITDGAKKHTSKELKELSKDSLIDLKDDSILLGGEKPSKRRLKLLSMWSGPKKHRMASLNAIAKVHCLYENESRTHMELGLMRTIDRPVLPSTSKATTVKRKDSKPKEMNQTETTSESDYDNKKDSNKKEDSSESSDDNPPVQRSLRGVPGIRSAGKYWDPKSSTSSSEDSELESKKKTVNVDKKKTTPKASSSKSDTEKPPAKMKKTAGVPVKKKRNRNEVVMDLKDMVVQKRMASLNATAILAASYEKRSPKSSKDDTTSDSCSDESFSQKPKNGVSSGVKSEAKNEEPKKEKDDTTTKDRKQKVEVIVNQDTDVTITGVYSTHHHEGFCTVSGMQYRISSTSHTQTTATANCDKEGCSREDGARYTPLSALSSMQPPAEHVHTHPHPVTELGGLARRAAGCSAFSAPSPAAHHEPG
ncbi:nucleolar protein dao-5-like isoform X2 [Leguminivora glycinivorella]|nr:nucleolar protein dao-5-like isoform X2 [Leguminivora glycinivorella]